MSGLSGVLARTLAVPGGTLRPDEDWVCFVVSLTWPLLGLRPGPR